MKTLTIPALCALLVFSTCKKDDPIAAANNTPGNNSAGGNEALISAISLGSENRKVDVPAEDGTTTLENVPHTVAGAIKYVAVNITVSPKATVKIGSLSFTQGQEVDFTNPVTFSVTAENGTTVKKYTVAIKPYDAVANPYGIYNAAHLSGMRNGLKAAFKLMNDITLPDTTAADAKTVTGIADYDKAGWLPVGDVDDDNGFKGSLDGGDHTIDNFYTKRGTAYVGLFGKLRNTASVKNLKVKGVDKAAVKGTKSVDRQYTGILAGFSEGTIENCHVSGNVFSSGDAGGLVGRGSKSAISRCEAMGNVSSPNPYALVGGLVGTLWEGKISNCYATGKVSSASNAGGLVGFCDKVAIDNCYTDGKEDVSSTSAPSSYISSAGGLVGECTKVTINNCYAVRNVSVTTAGTRTYTSSAGGLVGSFSENSILNNCYALGNVSSSSASSSYAGGLVGYQDYEAPDTKLKCIISNCYAVGNVSSLSSSTSSSKTPVAGGLVGDCRTTEISNSYGKSGATILANNVQAPARSDLGTGFTLKSFDEMKKDEFKGLLNKVPSSNAWGYTAGKNDDLPYLIGVGVGK